MNWIKQQNLSRMVIVLIIGLSMLFCCGAAWSSIVPSPSMEMGGHSACGMSDVDGDSGISHNYMIVVSALSLLKSLFPIFLIALLSLFLLVLSKDNLTFYSKSIRDKYGGFNLFNYFLRLFSVGILHPKTF